MKKNGFTLIELLVSITIVAILATIGLTMYSGAQKSAKIAKRSEDLRAVKNALEVYYSVNKSYPTTDSKNKSTCVVSDEIIPGFVPKYMNAIPKDPSERGCYVYKSNGTDYKFYIVPPFSDMSHADFQSQSALIDPKRDGDGADSISDCLVDGPNITAWAIWSSCDPDKCSEEESSCSW